MNNPVFSTAAATVKGERSTFVELIATNPNYFGNFPVENFPPVIIIQNNTTYEELTCLGFNPASNTLEAVIQVKQPSGYDGDTCTNGSFEYVRFYADYGSGFEDLGYVAVNVHNIPNALDCAKNEDRPLSFAASVTLNPKKNWCFFPELPKMRAILSWQSIPPAHSPNFNPVWGNHLDAHIQIAPRPLFFKEIGIEISEVVKKVIPAAELTAIENQPIPIPDPGPLDLAELAELYGASKATAELQKEQKAVAVPVHRFGFPELHAQLTAPVADSGAIAAVADKFAKLGLSYSSAVAVLKQTQADVSFEQLECLGLEGDPVSSRLVATLRIKRSSGYGGALCTAGSKEYVAFWADFNDTCQYTYLGTVAVNVHDFTTIPSDGLVYSAVLPVNLDPYRVPCDKPKVARVRAVLSWATPPSTTDPSALTTWGNLVDTHIQILPGSVLNPLTPTLSIIGGIPAASIDSTGFTVANARFAGNNLLADSLGRACPFGGVVELQGPEYPGYRYKIQVRPKAGGSWQDVATPLLLTRFDGTTYISSPDAQNFFPYQNWENNIENLLGEWNTSGDDVWEVSLQIADSGDNPVPGAIPDTHTVQLDNTAPVATIDIASGGDCGKYGVGVTLTGTFVATDANFGSYSVYTLPFPGPVVPSSGVTPTPATGSAWTLNTSALPQCGYVIVVYVSDRSIVNSAWGANNRASSSTGFCLLNQVS